MRKIASCNECPMYRDGNDASFITGTHIIMVHDVCGMNGREFTVKDGESSDPPPTWCPLRKGDAVVSLERVDA
jgi:hypothetical protein